MNLLRKVGPDGGPDEPNFRKKGSQQSAKALEKFALQTKKKKESR